MMTLTTKDVADIDLGRLEAAVSDWKATANHLKSLARDARNGMQKKSENARWAGANAKVTREFVRKTVKEIGDLHTEAQSIYQVRDDAHQELVVLQREVRSLVDQVKENGLTLTENNDTTVTIVEHLYPGEPSKGISPTEMKRLADRISAKLGDANEIDKSVKFALARIHGSDQHNAGHSDYVSLNDAQSARALQLAKKGTRMTNAELRELNTILKYNAKEASGEFATAFYKGLGGPKAALEFYGNMSVDGTQGDDKTRLSLARELQRGMGMALANATDPSATMANGHPYEGKKYYLSSNWGEQFRKLGTHHLDITGIDFRKPYGYQVLGGLLRYGDYDAKFLSPIAGHIVQLHHKDPTLFMLNKPNELSIDTDFGFNPSGKIGAGYDPLTSVLEALGHSPEASKEFFTGDSPVMYNESGTVNEGEHLGYNYFDELTKKNFDWPTDGTSPKAIQHGVDALGHALESATLGHAYDDSNPILHRDHETSELTRKVMQYYGDHPKLVKEQEVLSDSLGRIGAGYVDDIQWSLDEDSSDSIYCPKNPHEHALLPKEMTQKFLSTVGQHADAYADISSANKLYTTSAMEAQVNEDGSFNHGTVRTALRIGSEVQGYLDQSRADQIVAEGVEKDKEYNDALQKRNGWVKFGAGVVLAGSVAFLPEVATVGVLATAIPVMTDTGKGVLDNVIGNVMGDWTESNEQHSEDDIQGQVRDIYGAGKANTKTPMDAFASEHGIERKSGYWEDLEISRSAGYREGTNGENEQGQRPQTGDDE